MNTDCKLVVLSNEVITGYYSAIPFVKGKKRPSFNKKIVYNEETLRLLQNNYNYPKDCMKVFPDPRFLNSIFELPGKTATILFISQVQASFYAFANKFNELFQKSSINNKFKLIFKLHPLENITQSNILNRDIEVLKEKKLSFTPKYAISISSTLGLELLFDGSIVFFLSNNYYGIEKNLPFLICNKEQEVLDKITLLEKKPIMREELAKEIKKFVLEEYGLDKKSVLLAKFKRMIDNL
jgi:hypothetical protein